MTQRIAPRPEPVEPPVQLGPDGMGNPSLLPQEFVKPVDQSEHGVGPVTLYLGVPLQVRLNLVGPLSNPLPTCLRCRWQPSFERRNTAFVRRAPSPRRRPPPDLPTVDSRSRRSTNARGVTVGSICTIATRDSHYHRVPCPCTKYHRVLTRQPAALRFREASAT